MPIYSSVKKLGAKRLPFLSNVRDPDAQIYITAVETADGQTLESGVRSAINNFVIGCKLDGVWYAIKTSCILAGARTVSGALIPLAGTAPINNGFVSGDYNRKTGLKGATSNKYLNPNRTNNADPQDSRHFCVYTTEKDSGTGYFFLGTDSLGISGASGFYSSGSDIYYGISGSTNTGAILNNTRLGLMGASRSSSSAFTVRQNQADTIYSIASATPTSSAFAVFGRTGQVPTNTIDCRMSFYSIGEALDLSLLDARLVTLMSDLNNAIP